MKNQTVGGPTGSKPLTSPRGPRRQGLPTRRTLLLGVPFLLLLAVPFAAACHTSITYPATPAGQVPDYNFGEDFGLRYYLKSQGGNGFLTTDPGAASDDVLVKGDGNTGPTTGAGRMTGGDGFTIEFVAKDPFKDHLWLNLSKPFIGMLHVSSSGLQGSAKQDALLFRTSVYLDDTYIGGDECLPFAPGGTALAKWYPTSLKMRPEVDEFLPGQTLKVKVTFFGGLSDFRIGTGGEMQSLIEFRVTAYDLLSTAVYLENGRLRFGTGGVGASQEGAVPGGGAKEGEGLAFAAVLALPALAFAPRNRRALVALLFVAAAFAGCVGGAGADPKESGSGGPVPTLQTSSAIDPRLGRFGGIEGYVRNDLTLPIMRAHVVLIGSKNFTETDGKGYFRMTDVPAGTYRLRVDKDKYLPLEEPVKIEEGRMLSVNVTLVPPDSRKGNQREHDHDDWGGEVKIKQWSADADLKGYELVTSNGIGVLGSTGQDLCLHYVPCTGPFDLEEGKSVLPGTGMVEVVLSWNPSVLPFEEVGLTVTTPRATTFNAGTTYYTESSLMPRKAGVPFRIYVFPDEADKGHQKYTSWTMNAWLSHSRSQYSPWGQTSLGSPIHAEVTIHKGRVVPEPPHKDFWANRTQVQLLVDAKKVGCNACDMPSTTSSYSWYYYDWKSLIPAGTKEIQGTFRWENPTIPEAAQTQWSLLYKPGNSPYGWTLDRIKEAKPVPGTRSGTKIEFSIQPAAAELDPAYLLYSNWMFFIDDQLARPHDAVTYQANTGYSTNFYLTMKIIKDPEWKD